MSGDSTGDRLSADLEQLLFGDQAELYRQFVRATFVVTAGLVGAYIIARLGVFGLGDLAVATLGLAASIAITAFVLAGVVEIVVLGRVYQRSTNEVAQTAADLESAAERIESTAEELETTADTVGGVAETVDEAAEHVEETAEQTGDPDAVDQVAEAKDQAEDAKQTAAEAASEAESAKETATDVEQKAAAERERLPNEADQESDDKSEE